MKEQQRILLVDDDVLLTEVFSSVLESGGYEVAVVNRAADALQAALSVRPTLLLLDFDFPDATGSEVLANLRKCPEVASTRVAFLSGSNMALTHLDDRTWFISKPARSEALLDAVKLLLEEGAATESPADRLVA